MENVTHIAIDIAKQSFHLRAVNHRGRAVLDRKLSRNAVLKTVLNFPPGTVVVMEACGGAHYWARLFRHHGYPTKLLPPHLVKPFVKSQKNDAADAEAIAEAASRDTMRFVPVKTIEQQGMLALHRVRSRLVKQRTALMNELRGILLEFGVVVPQGVKALKESLRGDSVMSLPEAVLAVVKDLEDELHGVDGRITRYEKALRERAKQHELCVRLMTVPGIGVLTATALDATVGDPRQFRNGRALSAWLGLVPSQKTTGGRARLGRITKRGDCYLRQLMVHGARAVLKVAQRYKESRYSLWAKHLRDSKGYNKASVALANRNARIAWALMVKPDAVFSPGGTLTAA